MSAHEQTKLLAAGDSCCQKVPQRFSECIQGVPPYMESLVAGTSCRGKDTEGGGCLGQAVWAGSEGAQISPVPTAVCTIDMCIVYRQITYQSFG